MFGCHEDNEEFLMLKDVPHGEATKDDGGLPASFYVTEPSGMGLEVIDLVDYRIRMGM